MPVSKVPCRYAYNARGKLNRKHLCTERCSWTMRQFIDHLNRTPVPGHTEPRVQIEHLPCPRGKAYSDHLVTVANADGTYIKGVKFQSCIERTRNDDKLEPCDMGYRHLLTCVCSKCIDQEAKLEQAISRSA